MTIEPTADIFPQEVFRRSVKRADFPTNAETDYYSAPLTFTLSHTAEMLPEWGPGKTKLRDSELRKFWKTEDTLAGSVNAVVTRNAAFEWYIDGPTKTADAVTRMLHRSIANNQVGWIPFIEALSLDLYTTDNGAFIEIIRAENNPSAPVIGLAHLDSLYCFRTGNPNYPVVYTDDKGKRHKMPWYSVIAMSELTSSERVMRGVGFCSVSRVARYAQLLKDVFTYKSEKVSGRFVKTIHFVGGVSKREIEDIQKEDERKADDAGQTRFMLPTIIASLDPEKPVSTASIDIAALPDGFDLDKELKWYITLLSLGFGVDYQDFAPLPGGNLGTSTQSEILHRKSRGKGPAFFMQNLQNIFHYYGVIPPDYEFVFEDKDLASQQEEMQIKKLRVESRAIQIRSGEITPQVAREMAVRDGDLLQEDIAKIPEDYGEDMAGIRTDRAFSRTGDDTSSSRVTAEPKEEFD